MIDTIRHIEVFSPLTFGNQTVHVIGGGAVGSRVALGLAKLGISNIRVSDFDKIEAHNVANQIFGNNHIGKLKVNALRGIIKQQTGTVIDARVERVDGTQKMGDIVFLLTDTMSSRLEIWKAGLRYKTEVKLVIETRMGSNNGRVYTFNPCAPTHVKGWEATLYSDDIAEKSACGASITVGSTAEIVSGLAVWQMIRWHQAELLLKDGKTPKDEVENELVFSLQPMMVASSNF